jgi:hypothetical protein
VIPRVTGRRGITRLLTSLSSLWTNAVTTTIAIIAKVKADMNIEPNAKKFLLDPTILHMNNRCRVVSVFLKNNDES